MHRSLKTSRISRLLIPTSTVVSLSILASCGGSRLGGQFSAQYVYVATGTSIAQYAITIDGQLIPQYPPAAASSNAVWVVLNPKGTYAYAANKANNTLSQYTVGGTGLLTAQSPATVTTGNAPDSVVVSPDGKYVYVLNSGDSNITGFSIGSTGALSSLATVNSAVAADGKQLLVNGNFLYAISYSSGKINAFSIGVDGSLTPLAVPSYNVGSSSGATFSPDGKHLYVPDSTAGVAQFAVNTDGSLSPLSPATVAGVAPGNDTFGVSPNGKYGYLGSFNGGVPGSPVAQFSIGASGALSGLVPLSVTAMNAPQWIFFDASNKYAYVANGNDGTISEYSIKGDGTLAPLSPAAVNTGGALQVTMLIH